MISNIMSAMKNLRTNLIVGAIVILAAGLSDSHSAGKWTLLPAGPPKSGLRLLPNPDGTIQVVIGQNGEHSTKQATVSLNDFWTSKGTLFDIKFKKKGSSSDEENIIVEPGQPFLLQAQDISDVQLAWGSLTINFNGSDHILPLVLENSGPVVKNASPQLIPATGRSWLTIDMSKHRLFGKEAKFKLTTFRSSGQNKTVKFVKPADDNSEENGFISEPISEGQDSVRLEIDATKLLFDTDYTGALITKIDNRTFIETPVILRRKNWARTATLAPISNAQGESPLELILSTSAEQPVFGITVSSKTSSTQDFNPKDLEIFFKHNQASLWTIVSSDWSQVDARSLQPGDKHKVIVKAKQDLPPGTHEATLTFGALNVDQKHWVSTKVTFLVQNHPFWAYSTLVAAVLFSYITTKGLSTALRRRNLRRRIHNIRNSFWLRRDRWGSLPIVRAYARTAMAGRALGQKHGFRWLFRVVTTPDLIAGEITEVEKRLGILERLNKLAIYWGVAPSASGAKASGVHSMVVRRAGKILRSIVDQLSQLQEGEEVGTAVISAIEALEGWKLREHMQAGYWASLSADIQLLLDAVRVDQFDFDDKARSKLINELRDAEDQSSDDDAKKALSIAIASCEIAHKKGAQAVRDALTKAKKYLSKAGNADKIESLLAEIEDSEREVVRRLQQTIASTETPGTLHAMIRSEETYSQLKLIWEQRGYLNRRKKLFDLVRAKAPVEDAFKWIDDEVWKVLKQDNVVQIVSPGEGRTIEEYEPIDFSIVCNDEKADTYLFKHGLKYEWQINFEEGRQQRSLTPTTCSTTVTQFIPMAGDVNVSLTMRYGNDAHPVKAVNFETVKTTQFKHLWPVPTVELIGIALAFILAMVAGLQTNAFDEALAGSCKEYLALFAWGVGADQTRNLLQNLDTFTKGKDAPAS